VVEHLVGDEESADDAIQRCKSEAARFVEHAYLAWSILDAIEQVQLKVKADAGDPRAKESLTAKRRWAEENRKLAEAVAA
jgi:hypothetical protein